MIDLHCHVLPGLDDGAADTADAIAMGRQADADGIELICATPHIRHDHRVEIGELPARVAELNGALAEAGVRARVATGGEVAETALAGLSDADLRAVSLGGGGRWVLLEPAPGPLADTLDAAVRELGARGFGTVLAHPERHADADLAERLAALVAAGALVQVTAALLEHQEAAPVIAGLAERGLVHLIGSDAHSSRAGRPVRLSGAVAALARVERIAPHLDWIVRAAPAAIVRGEPVRPPFA